jgi:hypothetical protein
VHRSSCSTAVRSSNTSTLLYCYHYCYYCSYCYYHSQYLEQLQSPQKEAPPINDVSPMTDIYHFPGLLRKAAAAGAIITAAAAAAAAPQSKRLSSSHRVRGIGRGIPLPRITATSQQQQQQHSTGGGSSSTRAAAAAAAGGKSKPKGKGKGKAKAMRIVSSDSSANDDYAYIDDSEGSYRAPDEEQEWPQMQAAMAQSKSSHTGYANSGGGSNKSRGPYNKQHKQQHQQQMTVYSGGSSRSKGKRATAASAAAGGGGSGSAGSAAGDSDGVAEVVVLVSEQQLLQEANEERAGTRDEYVRHNGRHFVSRDIYKSIECAACMVPAAPTTTSSNSATGAGAAAGNSANSGGGVSRGKSISITSSAAGLRTAMHQLCSAVPHYTGTAVEGTGEKPLTVNTCVDCGVRVHAQCCAQLDDTFIEAAVGAVDGEWKCAPCLLRALHPECVICRRSGTHCCSILCFRCSAL